MADTSPVADSVKAAVKAAAAGKEVAFFPENYPEVKATSDKPLQWKGDLLALGVFEEALDTSGDKTVIKSEELKAADEALGGLLSELIELGEFKAKQGSSTFARHGGAARVVGLVGLGPAAKASLTPEWGPSPFQELGVATAAAAKANKAKSAAVAVLGDVDNAVKAGAAGKVAAGALLGAYEAVRFKAKAAPSPLVSLAVLGLGSGADHDSATQRAAAFAKGVILTRYLVEAPPNVCTPTHLADAAAAIAASAPDTMKLTVLERAECEELGMGLYLGVAACSEEPPKFIHLVYTPKGGSAKRKVALVGKGLTFDSGGYNLKVGGMIEMMKFDMGGAGAVLGAAQAVAGVQPEGVEVHFIIASCENMIDGKGMRPGDILTASNGKTVEVNNTDAEGRLTLADALIYAQKQGIEAVVDIATLTGACMVALGNSVGGLFTPADSMAAQVKSASVAAGEKVWRMPMEEGYWEQMKSPIADMKNTGTRYGGAITAALFLKQYVDTDKVQWAHLDIAGPCWDDKQGGATGFGAATLAEWAIAQGKQ